MENTKSNRIQSACIEPICITEATKQLFEDFCGKASSHGYKIRPYTSSTLPHFETLSADRKSAVYKNFSRYVTVLDEAERNGISWTDNVQIVWRMIRELGLRPPSELFSKFEENEVIEIYDGSFVQVFRNLAFFEVCSYSLEELFCFEWTELYQRPQSATDKLIELCTNVFNGKLKEPVLSGVPDHELHEVFSSHQNVIHMQQRWISPLFDENGSPAGVMGTTKCKVIYNKISMKPSKVGASLRDLD